ncbi:MAG: hypothetical protein ACYTXT_40535 [Nostoc sp.]
MNARKWVYLFEIRNWNTQVKKLVFFSLGGTDLLAIAICAEKSRHPFSPLRRILQRIIASD